MYKVFLHVIISIDVMSYLLNLIQKKEEISKPEPAKESKQAVASEKAAGESKKSKAKPASDSKAAKPTPEVTSESKKGKSEPQQGMFVLKLCFCERSQYDIPWNYMETFIMCVQLKVD